MGSHFSAFVVALELKFQAGFDIFLHHVSLSISASLSLPLFLGPLVIPISVRGEVLRHFSSSSQSSSTPPRIHSLVISAGLGTSPLYPPL